MDKERVSKEINKLMKNSKFVNCIIAVLVIVFLWLMVSTFSENGFSLASKDSVPRGAQEVNANQSEYDEFIKSYEERQKEDLTNILSKIEGVGEVSVMISFESGEVQVPAFNSTTQVSETKESDTQGGTRDINQQNDGNTIVMSTNNNNNEPFIIKTYNPPVVGVVIVAEGAESNKVKYDIQMAVSALYDLTFDKVNVYPTEG